MYKMVVSSFFNTLIDSEEAISYSTMKEIDKLRREYGVIFTIMTDSPLNLVIDYNRDFPFIDYIIAFNGGYVYDVLNRKVISKKSMGVLTIKKIYRLFSELNICFYTLEYGAYWGSYLEKHYSFKINDFSSFLDSHRLDVYKIAIICDNKLQVRRVLKSIDDYEVNVDTKIVEKDGKIFVELYSKMNDKLNGIMKIAKLNKIEMDDILAIVCSDSDINVAKSVGKSVVVSNGSNKVKKYCKEETLSNDDKGVEAVLKKYFI